MLLQGWNNNYSADVININFSLIWGYRSDASFHYRVNYLPNNFSIFQKLDNSNH